MRALSATRLSEHEQLVGELEERVRVTSAERAALEQRLAASEQSVRDKESRIEQLLHMCTELESTLEEAQESATRSAEQSRLLYAQKSNECDALGAQLGEQREYGERVECARLALSAQYEQMSQT